MRRDLLFQQPTLDERPKDKIGRQIVSQMKDPHRRESLKK